MSFKPKLLITISTLIVVFLLLFLGQNLKIFNSPATVLLSPIQTALEWYSSDYPGGKTDWNTASSFCSNLPKVQGLYPGVSWRLPTINELISVHGTTSTSTISNLQNWFYWSSTEIQNSTTTVYDLDMTPNPSNKTIFKKNLPDDYVRCVRNVIISVPDAPTNIYGQEGNEQATISFTSPEPSQYSDTFYTVTSNPDNITATGSSSPIIVTGLTNGTVYTFTVTATNIAGTSTVSDESNLVIPNKIRRTGRPAVAGTYSINSWSDLDNLRNILGTEYYSFVLTTDLSSTTPGYAGLGDNWNPIGTDTSVFAGNFNGNNFTISDLIINKPIKDNVGLFASITGGIYDLGLVNVNITGHSNTGGITGTQTSGTISNCYVTGLMNNSVASVGGLVGLQLSAGIISGSYSTANVNGNSSGGVGGLVGNSQGTILNSYATGNVIGYSYVGGFVGYSSGTITNSYSIGNVFGSLYFGGLIGEGGISITGSFWDTQTSGQPTSDGGTGKTTAEMKTASTYTEWDTEIWRVVDGSYPTLIGGSTFVFITPPIPAFAIGLGTVDDPYEISSWYEMNNVRSDLDAYYILTTDLSSSTVGYFGTGDSWVPTGTDVSAFAGNFNGNNFTISDLIVNLPSGYYVGLFGNITGVVSDLSLNNFNITGNGFVGCLSGKESNANISNIHVTETVISSGGTYTGGLIGDALNGVITNASAVSTINGYGYTGGLIGYVSGTNISNSYSSGSITGLSGSGDIGGLIGNMSSGTISDSYSTANVVGGFSVGGLVGERSSTTIIDYSYSTGFVNAPRLFGGLIGYKANPATGITISFWNSETSYSSPTVGGTGKTTNEMLTASTYTGWDTGTWNIVDGSYPTLISNLPMSITSPSINFGSVPASIQSGSSAVIKWVIFNADSCTASGGDSSWPGNISAVNGLNTYSATITNQGTYTYDISCSGTEGTISSSLSLNVGPGFSANRGSMGWSSATTTCSLMIDGGFSWRLPTSNELLAYYDSSAHISGDYWTSTLHPTTPTTKAYYVTMSDGTPRTTFKTTSKNVMCIHD